MAKILQLIATEAQEQTALVNWIRLQRRFDGLLIKLNNEGKRTCFQGANLKRLGMEPGASDLFLACPTTQYCGLWIEVKQNRKYPPSEMAKSTWIGQQRFINRMISVGYAGHFCYGWEHGKRIIESYLEDTISVP